MKAAHRKLLVGTRTSKLAMRQTECVIDLLRGAWPDLECETRSFVTEGDRELDVPLPEIGGRGVFTERLGQALEAGEVDIAVHSLKDLPVEASPGLTVGAVAQRAEIRDALVARNGWTLATLPEGAVVGTSSTRRQAQVLAIRPDVIIKSIRGNVPTRIRKVDEGEYDAVVLAAAGLERLELMDRISELLPLETMLPAPGQGALAIQCRADDTATQSLLAAIDDKQVRDEVLAERTFLEKLGGGCSLPIAAAATSLQNGSMTLRGLVTSPDGQTKISVDGSGVDPRALGIRLAERAMAKGAREILSQTETTSRSAQPLSGKRIVVTRATDQADSLCEKLEALGATSVRIPMIKIVPLDDPSAQDAAIDRLPSYDWVVFTSTNGANMFWQRFTAMNASIDDFRHTRVAAVGPATAERLRGYGVNIQFTPERFVSDELLPGLGDVSGANILLARAAIARKDIVNELESRGANIDDIATHRTLAPGIDATHLETLRSGVDAVTFASSSAVHNFDEGLAAQDETPALLGKTVIVCIGPVTARTARECGFDSPITARQHTGDGLIEALVTHFGRNQQQMRVKNHGKHATVTSATERTTGPIIRPRRLRTSPRLRNMVRETDLAPRHFICPLFVTHGERIRNPIASMPGVFQLSVDEAVREATEVAGLDISAVMLFGIPAAKDPVGMENFDPDGVVQRAVRAIKEAVPDLIVVTDVCLCEYTDHGHCGILNTGGASRPN
ncbi:MAG: hydroxymethylbilane synthase, partial [bacterium]|nr:hydroxymethylbilane synthase [bacterium]